MSNIFQRETVSYGHEEYELEVLKHLFQYFRAFPTKHEEIASPITVAAIVWLMDGISPSQMTHFANTTVKEVSQRDRGLVGRVMKLDWRDRPTASQLLKDRWFKEDYGGWSAHEQESGPSRIPDVLRTSCQRYCKP